MKLTRNRRQTVAWYAGSRAVKAMLAAILVSCLSVVVWSGRDAITNVVPIPVPSVSALPTNVTPSIRVDDCPDGDYSGFPSDGQCGEKPATPDSCPSGDWTGNYFDGNCGVRPTNPDVCPDGDYSGSPIDGKCGTKPTTPTVTKTTATAPKTTPTTPKTTTASAAKTFSKSITCDGNVLLAITASGKGKVSINVSGAASASGSTSVTLQGPAGRYQISVTDSGGSPKMSYTSKGAVCS